MSFRNLIAAALLVALVGGVARSYFQDSAGNTGANMVKAANAYIKTLDDKQKKTSLMKYESKKRVDWHFIPKKSRKGLQIKHMNKKQRKAAFDLLASCLSAPGNNKARKIMELEGVLKALEKGRKGGPVRDTERYYYTIFGTPSAKGKWGLSIEGHHLSLNYVVANGKVVSSTPQFFAANPGEMKATVGKIKKGVRVLKKEETLAFKLVNSLSKDQKKIAVIAAKAPREIRGPGAAQPVLDKKPVGISYAKLNKDQQETIRELVKEYIYAVPNDVRQARINGILQGKPENVHFAWAGAQKPGVGHYYRIQGPSFIIEFVNTQPDAAGNPANHIHAVWRDAKGDFAIAIK